MSGAGLLAVATVAIGVAVPRLMDSLMVTMSVAVPVAITAAMVLTVVAAATTEHAASGKKVWHLVVRLKMSTYLWELGQ